MKRLVRVSLATVVLTLGAFSPLVLAVDSMAGLICILAALLFALALI